MNSVPTPRSTPYSWGGIYIRRDNFVQSSFNIETYSFVVTERFPNNNTSQFLMDGAEKINKFLLNISHYRSIPFPGIPDEIALN